MTRRAQKLLERMRSSKSGWKRRDLDRLYLGFGFLITHGANHDIVKHPKYPQLRATLSRHKRLPQGYIEYAIKLVDALLALEKMEDNHETMEGS